MESVLHNRRPDATSYALLGVLLAMLTASFLGAWHWCSESWFRMGFGGGGTNAGYSPGPLVPILVLLMLSTRLRRLEPTPGLGLEDRFHAAYMKVLNPVVVQVVALYYRLRGVSVGNEEIRKAAYEKRRVAVWGAWLVLAALTAVALRNGRNARPGEPSAYFEAVGLVLFFVEIVLFSAAVTYVAWRLYRADEQAQTAARSPVHVIAGSVIVVLALMVHFAAIRGLMPQLSIMAFMACLVGLLWVFYGWRTVRLLIFPLAFMVLTLPMDWVEAQIGLPAQVFATKYSVAIMQFIGLKVEMIGRTAFDIIKAGESIDFKVDAPCSGLKSLVALTAISATYGYVTQKTTAKVIIIMACGPFLAIITNIIRLVAVGVTAHLIDRQRAMWVHDHALPIYILAILLLMLIDKLLNSRWLRIEDF